MRREQNTDRIYYAHGGKIPLAVRISLFARDRMYEHFIAVMRPDRESTILDEPGRSASHVRGRHRPSLPCQVPCRRRSGLALPALRENSDSTCSDTSG